MAQEPKHFQSLTVDAAVRALTSGSRRFLLADEVGLGKTVVAKGVIAKLAGRPRGGEPFRVFYFGSGRTVTAQNAPRLRPEGSLRAELCDASRPTLIAMDAVPKAEVLIFQFTPETAVPRVHGRGRAGVAIERALLRVLVSKVLHVRLPSTEATRGAFQGVASRKGFRREVRSALKKYRSGGLLPGYGLSDAFRQAVREEFRAGANEHLPDRLLESLKDDPKACVATLRVALTRAALRCMPPHLIVFDEFHKYRKRVFALPGEKDDDVFLSLLSRETRPAVLLLSATPFQQDQVVARGSDSQAGSADFHRLVGFLHGSGGEGEAACKKCSDLFAEFERVLSSKQPGELDKVRKALEDGLLRPRMARMERAAFRAVGVEKSASEDTPLPDRTDLEFFARFSAALQSKDKPAAIAYWRSVPYAHQFLGGEYVAWRHALQSKWRHLPSVTREQRDTLRMRKPVPNLRFRQLLREFPPDLLALPWMAPSVSWWTLRGPWASEEPVRRLEKGLLFSAYRATPRSIAGLMSFAVEDWAARQRGWSDSRRLNKQSFLSPKSVTVVALFHPSVWLAKVVDPLAVNERSGNALLAHAARSVRAALPDSIKYLSRSKRHRQIWELLPMIESESGLGIRLRDLWSDAVGKQGFGGQVGRALSRMQGRGCDTARTLSPLELKDLAWFALSAPGVVLLRALRRNWIDATTDAGMIAVADLAWNGLRPYLDRPWFVARLMKGRAVSGYPEAIQRAVLDGNLEAVLDEQFWLPDPDHEHWLRTGRKQGRLEALRNTLGIRSAPVKAFSPGNPGRGSFKLSAHAAMPLTDTEAHTAVGSGVKKLRADDLRRAFNTPFWPHLLCTTSVGQEGLDFHQWCRSIIHWDLCASPVDVEQREGRIDRYKSLAVRKALAKELAHVGDRSWKELEARARAFADKSELAPWWIFKGAATRRVYLDPPSSEERVRKHRLRRLRELYRLVLGLPHAQDMLVRLESTGMSIDEIRRYCLDLGALRRPT